MAAKITKAENQQALQRCCDRWWYCRTGSCMYSCRGWMHYFPDREETGTRRTCRPDLKIPDKKRLADFPNYLIHRASKLKNLFIFKNTEATIEMIRSMNPNIIVNATGSNPLLPPIKGLHENIDKEGGKVSSITNMINHVMEYPEDLKGKKSLLSVAVP